MRIVEIREKAIRQKRTIQNAVRSSGDLTTSIVAVITDVVRNGRPIVGYAFNSVGRHACGTPMRERFIPRLLEAPEEAVTLDPKAFDPDKILDTMIAGEKLGGDVERSVPVGTIECAVWDAVGKIADVPVYKLIADRYRDGAYDKKVFCYIGGGWYVPGGGVPELVDEMKSHLDNGYTLLKTKVGGLPVEQDKARVEAVINLVGGDPERVAVDANAGIDDERRPGYARAFGPLGLRWFEEPAHPVDYQGNADFIAEYKSPVATGENLFSLEDVRNLVRHGGMRAGVDVLQSDIPQCYGIAMAARILRMLGQHGWSPRSVIPHGGHMMGLNQAAGLGLGMCEAYRGGFGVFAGYADDLKVEDGWLTVGDWAGMGFERQNVLYGMMREVAA
jgi:L-alanine-DL-glutamate epimerase-like enolase superfamily enzyme